MKVLIINCDNSRVKKDFKEPIVEFVTEFVNSKFGKMIIFKPKGNTVFCCWKNSKKLFIRLFFGRPNWYYVEIPLSMMNKNFTGTLNEILRSKQAVIKMRKCEDWMLFQNAKILID